MHKILLALWAAILLLSSSYLLARHVLTLPAPGTSDPALRAAVARSRSPEEQGRPLAVHFLLSGCRCSERIFKHLIRRGAMTGLAERVVLIGAATGGGPGDPSFASLRARGFAIETFRAKELAARYHIEAAPLLVLADARGALRYVGGYTERKQGPTIQDRVLIEDLLIGQDDKARWPRLQRSPLPLFGCPVSEALRVAVDPFGLSTKRTRGTSRCPSASAPCAWGGSWSTSARGRCRSRCTSTSSPWSRCFRSSATPWSSWSPR